MAVKEPATTSRINQYNMPHRHHEL